jgi:hypothetical protein
MTISSDFIGEVEYFKYLGSFVQKNRSLGMNINHRIKYVWMKWREASGVLGDERIPIRLKGKLYRNVVLTNYAVWFGVLSG